MIYDPESLDKITEQAKQKLTKNSPYANLYDDDEEDEDMVSYIPEENEYSKLDQEYKYTKKFEEGDIEYATPGDTISQDEIFPGGPNIHEINKWKQQYSDCYVFAIELVGEMFVCRTITRPEYRALVTKYELDQIQREELICMTCILFPYSMSWDDIIKLKGGIPSTLASIIMEHSGFTTQYGVNIL